MLLASVLPEHARVTGVDREPRWIEQATARARARGVDGRFHYRHAEAQRLPFADNSFDLTTCQTVLIHLPDPVAAIAEMMRVTRPGGLVAVAEPNNLTAALLLDSVSNQASVEEIVALVRFQLTCERGKVALGEGDNSLGDRVPGLFAAQGLIDIDVYANDKATAVFPPMAPVHSGPHRRGARPPGAAPLELERARVATLFSRGRWVRRGFCHSLRARPCTPREDRSRSGRRKLSRHRRWSVFPRVGTKGRKQRVRVRGGGA